MNFQNNMDFLFVCRDKICDGFKMMLSFTKKQSKAIAVLLGFTLFLFGWLWFGVYQPSNFFPIKKIITIPEGATIGDVGDLLKSEQVVRSSLAFRVFVSAFSNSKQVRAGDYYFTKPLTLKDVANRITNGVFGLEPVKITIPEGATTYQMVDIFEKKFDRFDSVLFLMLAKDKEGYLFPDTYLFLPNVSTEEIVNVMERTFYERLQSIEGDIAKFGRPVHEVVTMASLLEKEARDFEERRTIAGVLWKRVDINMPLQVDAVFGFIEKRETFNPKFSDLEVDSPYNIYKNKGLPPGPIGSPSLEAIKAAVTPKKTDALFYLHGKDGVLRLAKTYSEHLINKRKYLN
jgi:UPF0755 protein